MTGCGQGLWEALGLCSEIRRWEGKEKQKSGQAGSGQEAGVLKTGYLTLWFRRQEEWSESGKSPSVGHSAAAVWP